MWESFLKFLGVSLAPIKSAVVFFYGLNTGRSFIAAEDRSAFQRAEIQNLLAAILREKWIRLAVIVLLVVILSLYLSWPALVILFAAIVGLDVAEVWLLRQTLADQGRQIYGKLVVGTVYLIEFVYCLPIAIIWQMEDPYSKAISVGLIAAAMVRLTTIRSNYPITGYVGLAAQASIIAVTNTYYWLNLENYAGLAFTTAIAATSVGYVIAAIRENHRQMTESAISRLVAQRASDSKSYFLAQMSHELRTPLNAIIGMAVVSHVKVTEPQIKRQLAVLINAAQGLATVLDDVLDMAAIETGRIIIRPRQVDIVEEINGVVALFKHLSDESNIDLSADIAEGVPKTLLLDADRLRQCIFNLISNALKHTNEGQVRVKVRFDPPGTLEIAVADTGSGIPSGSEASIFDKRDRRPDLIGGNGLGLSICRAIVLQMGGQIAVASSQSGAQFTLCIPVEVATTQSEEKTAMTNEDKISGTTVLVVDDIATNRIVAMAYLRLLHCAPVEASSGAEALRILTAGHKIDLVLMDINMPTMSGLDTLKLIRAAEGPGRVTPVIAMTADASERDRLLYVGEGMDGYLSKPMRLEAVSAEIRRVLSAAPAQP